MPRLVTPTLLMGLANLPFGLFGVLALVTTPQLLAARGVPQPRIDSRSLLGALVLTPVVLWWRRSGERAF